MTADTTRDMLYPIDYEFTTDDGGYARVTHVDTDECRYNCVKQDGTNYVRSFGSLEMATPWVELADDSLKGLLIVIAHTAPSTPERVRRCRLEREYALLLDLGYVSFDGEHYDITDAGRAYTEAK